MHVQRTKYPQFDAEWLWAAGPGWIHPGIGVRLFSNGDAVALHFNLLIGELLLQVTFAKQEL